MTSVLMVRSNKQLFVENMSEEQLNIVEKRMFSGYCSKAGFLGDKQSLKDIALRDRETLQKTGMTFEKFADRLDSIIHQSEDAQISQLHYPPLVEGKYLVHIQQAKGWQVCPFTLEEDSKEEPCTKNMESLDIRSLFIDMRSPESQETLKKPKPIVKKHYTDECDQHIGSAVYVVTRTDTNERFSFASLMPHIIRDHHFFQGGPYRVDPEKGIAFFEMKNIRYTDEPEK